MKVAKESFFIFLQFMHRDFVTRKKKLWDNVLNYACIYPLVFSLGVLYLQANIYFGTQNLQKNTALFAGNILLIIMLFTYKQNIELLFDFENERFIDYQLILLNPFLVICERIFFTGLYTFVLTLPFYPVSYFLFSTYLDMVHISWMKLMTILFCSALCLSAYHLLASCLLEGANRISSLWNRSNNLLLSFGGFWIPWYILYQYSPVLAYSTYLNPCMFITEGIKGAITGNTQFLSFSLCINMLLLWTIIFTLWSWKAFKNRTDCL